MVLFGLQVYTFVVVTLADLIQQHFRQGLVHLNHSLLLVMRKSLSLHHRMLSCISCKTGISASISAMIVYMFSIAALSLILRFRILLEIEFIVQQDMWVE